VEGALRQAWTGLEASWQWLGRRTAWLRAYAQVFAFGFGAVAVILAALHSADLPDASAWTAGHALPLVQIGAVAAWLLTQLGILIGDFRSRRSQRLVDACRAVAAFIDDQCPELPLREVGVRIWMVSGPPWARHLRRGGSFLLAGERARTGIRWMKGKGVVGTAWSERLNTIRDLAEIRSRATTRSEYERLDDSEKLGLTWDEFRRAPTYQAVFACPLYSRVSTSGDPPVRGVLAIDLLASGHFEQLEVATEDSGFEGVVGTCEDALTPK
jgi:hypothetical protein